MVGNITSFTGNGLKDWLWQRVSAVVLGVYFVGIMCFFFNNPQPTYSQWVGLFQCNLMRFGSIIALFAFVAHAWIGLWTVSTDYIKCTKLRVPLQVLLILFLMGLLIWGIEIFWSV